MRIIVIILGSVALLSGEIFWTGGATRVWQRHTYERDNPRLKLETRFSEANLVLHQLDVKPTPDISARTIILPRESLRDSTLYLRDESSERAFLYADADGYLHRDGEVIRQVQRDIRIVADLDTISVFTDSTRVCDLPRNRWAAFVAGPEQATMPKSSDTPKVSIRDGFMRDVFSDDNWRTISGKWNLRQHGGGLPDDEKEEESYDFQRAVNPFSLLGSQNGQVIFGRGNLPHARISARFYFGRPVLKDTVDYRPLEQSTDALLTVGQINGRQYAFGWYGPADSFCLLQGIGPGTWKVVETYKGPIPPLTNWMKLELQLHRAGTLVALLDNQPIFSQPLGQNVEGIFGIATGTGLIELDDVRLNTLPSPATAKGSPVYVKSRGFAAKKIKNGRDPVQFQQWARASNTYLRSLEKMDDNRILRRITNRIPIYGDLTYESIPYHEEVGALPDGRWQFHLANRDGTNKTTIEAEKSKKGWRVLGMPPHIWPEDHHEFTLRFFRTEANNSQPTIQIKDARIPIGRPIAGAIHVSIGRWYQQGDRLDPPEPEHHLLRDGNLRHEFFEEAATDWNWADGGFRMAARWACQAQWNFMACGSPGTPLLASKTMFNGDQEHDYHMTIRPCTPWDAGDSDWIYTRKQFDQNRGWYSRHNLNFSFCSDAKNPLSGYAIIFAGDENERTMLLKEGNVIASTDNPDFLITKKSNFLAVHWSWWHFHVRKTGGRIQVACNDEPLFDVVDPSPIEGGHVGFWTVRNGFVVSRITSVADSVTQSPQAGYLPAQRPSTFWRPIRQNSLTATEPSATTERFTMNTGAGFQAVRHVFADPVDLKKTPNLALNLKLSENAKVNLHVQVDGQGYLVQVSAPLTDMKRILIPEGEITSEQFRLAVMSEASVAKRLLATTAPGKVRLDLNALLSERKHKGPGKLEALTIGNSSNQNYLLAGGGGNTSGEWYEVSRPSFR